MVLKGENKVDEILERVAGRFAAKSILRMIEFETQEERDAYMLGTKDMAEMLETMSEKMEAEKEKSFHNPAFDALINAFLFGNEEE